MAANFQFNVSVKLMRYYLKCRYFNKILFHLDNEKQLLFTLTAR